MSGWDYGGQRRNMENASMVGTLAHQAALIWPRERDLLRRRLRPPPECVLDIGCGTGEILRRFRDDFAPRRLVGLDLFAGHARHAPPPVVLGDGFRAPFPDATFDLVLVRHLLQALPDPPALLREVRRLLRPEGRVHLLVEDYAGLLFDIEDHEVADNFREVAPHFRRKGTDLYQGRRAPRHLREAGFRDITVDPIVVDNQTAARDDFAGVLRHWRDGYAATLAGLLARPEADVRRRFDLMIENVRDPARYAAWLLFAVSAIR
jgi:ubiquinone/menaquinone biosynthesis C-methylase UbiE